MTKHRRAAVLTAVLIACPLFLGQAPVDDGQAVLIQWTKDSAPGWELWHARRFGLSKRKPIPRGQGQETIDDRDGWIFSLNVQGVVFAGMDHYAVEHVQPTRAVRVYAWNDDPEDYLPEEMFGMIWEFPPIRLRSNRRLLLNTEQRRIMYLNFEDKQRRRSCDGDPTCVVRPWSEWADPPSQITRHGVWVSDELALEHEDMRPNRGWQEWARTRDLTYLRWRSVFLAAYDGIAYTYLGTNLATGVHTPNTSFSNYCEKEMNETSPESSATCSVTGIGISESDIGLIFTTLANEPGVADWESGNYTCSNNVQTAPAELTYGVKTQGSANGHMARVDSGLTTDQTTIVGTTNFTGTGIKTETVNTDPSNCSDTTCRFECAWAVVKSATHGNATLAFEVDITGNDGGDCDNCGDGAWTPPPDTYQPGEKGPGPVF